MQRGTLILSKEEYNQLLTVLDINRLTGTQLFEKLNSALQSTQEEVRISISEDEIEQILDEVGPPISNNEILNRTLKKISALMLTFRQGKLPDLDSN